MENGNREGEKKKKMWGRKKLHEVQASIPSAYRRKVVWTEYRQFLKFLDEIESVLWKTSRHWIYWHIYGYLSGDLWWIICMYYSEHS